MNFDLAADALATLPRRKRAELMYYRGYNPAEIARIIEEPERTVRHWKTVDQWDKASVVKRVEATIEMRLNQIIAKPDKTLAELNEMERIMKLLERTARIDKYRNGGHEGDLNPKVNNRNAAKRKKAKEREGKCVLTEEQIREVRAYFLNSLYPHQRAWLEHGKKYEMRQYVKSRQIGATYTFAGEALLTALGTGKNQIFISASKNQAQIFRSNIVNLVEQAVGVTLKGEHIKLGNGAILYFLGTNSNTVQSYSGDLYIDEYFWIPNFSKIQHVASGMAVHDDRRITYFSTPSTVAHEAYPMWTGEAFNAGRPKKDHIKLDISHAVLKDGRLCEDGYFRQMIIIEDAINSGFDRVTLEKLRIKYTPAQFENLLMCQFVNDANSLFKLAALQRCMVDSWTVWHDFKPLNARPLGDAPVWIGYDPSRSQDDASLVVVAPPSVSGGDFRIIEHHSFNGLDFDSQAKKIKTFLAKYNVQYIGIDATGIGLAVYELVQQFFPRVTKILYNVEEKNAMVLKAAQLVQHARLKFDASATDIAQAFMTIYQAPTSSGRAITYKAARTAQSGHADLAWATMHALIHDPLSAIDEAGTGKKKGKMAMF